MLYLNFCGTWHGQVHGHEPAISYILSSQEHSSSIPQTYEAHPIQTDMVPESRDGQKAKEPCHLKGGWGLGR